MINEEVPKLETELEVEEAIEEVPKLETELQSLGLAPKVIDEEETKIIPTEEAVEEVPKLEIEPEVIEDTSQREVAKEDV